MCFLCLHTDDGDYDLRLSLALHCHERKIYIILAECEATHAAKYWLSGKIAKYHRVRRRNYVFKQFHVTNSTLGFEQLVQEA